MKIYVIYMRLIIINETSLLWLPTSFLAHFCFNFQECLGDKVKALWNIFLMVINFVILKLLMGRPAILTTLYWDTWWGELVSDGDAQFVRNLANIFV